MVRVKKTQRLSECVWVKEREREKQREGETETTPYYTRIQKSLISIDDLIKN
jgi:hypothetical protein